MLIIFPNILAVNESYRGNRIWQVAMRCAPVDGTLATFKRGKLDGLLFQPTEQANEVLITTQWKHISSDYQRVVCAEGALRNSSDLGLCSFANKIR
jgi:hypothetical protein